MPKNDLAVQQVGDDIHILGILDADEDHKKFAGIDPRHAKSALLIKQADASEEEIRSAVSIATIWGKRIGAHVKFASPIIIKDAVSAANPIGLSAQLKRDVQDKKQKTEGDDIILADPRIQQLFEPQSEPDKEENEQADTNASRNTENMPSTNKVAAVTITYTPQLGVYDLLDTLQEAVKQAAILADPANDMVKEAHKYGMTAFIDAMADARIDGTKVGFDLPVKLEFGSERMKDAFLLLGKREPKLEVDPDAFKQHADSLPNQPSNAMKAKMAREKVDGAMLKVAHSRMPVSMKLARLRRLLTTGSKA